jgi:hypothetical protein
MFESGKEESTYTLLRHRASDGGTLHLALRVDDNTGVVLKRTPIESLTVMMGMFISRTSK